MLQLTLRRSKSDSAIKHNTDIVANCTTYLDTDTHKNQRSTYINDKRHYTHQRRSST